MSHVDDGALTAFLDGELDDAACERLDRHVQGCPDCTARLEETARVQALATSLVQEAGEIAGAAPAWSELLTRAAAAADNANGPTTARRSPLLPALAWAATLVVAFAIGWQARQPELPQAVPLPQAQAPASAELPAELPSVPAPALEPTPSLAAAPEMEAEPDAAVAAAAPAADELDAFETIRVDDVGGRFGAAPLLPPQAEVLAAAIGPGDAMAGGRAGVDVLRLELLTADGDEVTLLQQYEGAPAAASRMAAPAAPTVRAAAPQQAAFEAAAEIAADVDPIDATFSLGEDGRRRLQWRHPAGYLLVLESAQLDEAQLRALARSLR